MKSTQLSPNAKLFVNINGPMMMALKEKPLTKKKEDQIQEKDWLDNYLDTSSGQRQL